jgi:GT2 family glycosyltransferase
MAISRFKYELIGAFDESFIICGSDVEICIRAYKRGFYNVLCAESRLYHFESKTRTPHIPDIDFEQSKIKYEPYRLEKTDPFYNRNLSLTSNFPSLSEAPRVV